MVRANKYFINVLAQAAGRIFSTVVGILIFVLIARFLGAEIFGKYSYVITFLGIFVIVADFGTQVVLAKDISQIKESVGEYWGNFLVLRFGLSLSVIIPSAIIAYYLRRDLFIFIVLGSLSLPFLCSRFFEPVYQIYQRPWFSTFSSVVYGGVYLLFTVLALFFTKGLLPIVLAYAASNLIYAFFALFLSFKLLKPVFDIKVKTIKNILKFSLPIGVSSLFTIVNSKADIFMLAHMRSDYEVGIYSAAYKFLDVTVMLAAIAMTPLIPIFSEKAINNCASLKRIYMKSAELLAIFAVPAAIIIPRISLPLVNLLFGAAFYGSAGALNILVWAGVLVFYSLTSSILLLSIGVIKQAYWTAAAAAVLNITLNYMWIPKYSYIGSAWATVISEIFLFGVCVYYLIRNMGNVFDRVKWVKIITANLILFFLLQNTRNELNIFLKISLSLATYLLLLILFKVVSSDIFDIFFIKKQALTSRRYE